MVRRRLRQSHPPRPSADPAERARALPRRPAGGVLLRGHGAGAGHPRALRRDHRQPPDAQKDAAAQEEKAEEEAS